VKGIAAPSWKAAMQTMTIACALSAANAAVWTLVVLYPMLA
jgi:hypothetical protein